MDFKNVFFSTLLSLENISYIFKPSGRIILRFLMIDLNECTNGTHDCHLMAVCNNTKGSYNCSCKEGYKGDGRNCTGKFRIY